MAPELMPRGRVLEIGVGTGQLALPFRAAGIDVMGVDISKEMLKRLRLKAGAGAAVPVSLADATRLPFGDATFGGAYFRWVLHLIPTWRAAIEETVRVVEPGGVVVGMLGSFGGRPGEIRRHCCDLLGVSGDPVGLGWGETDPLDEHMASLGCDLRLIGPYKEEGTERLDDYLREVSEGKYSWTWTVPDDARREAVERIRPWAQERWGPLDRELTYSHEGYWRAYDLPSLSASLSAPISALSRPVRPRPFGVSRYVPVSFDDYGPPGRPDTRRF
jgi:SAM-dependent methyltransferase